MQLKAGSFASSDLADITMTACAKTKTLVIVQSNYIPWKGYFDLINLADHLILYDDVQFTKNDWRNRNVIKTFNGPHWLTIPVTHKFGQKIKDTEICFPGWAQKHWKTIAQSYSKAPCFNRYKEVFETLYLNTDETFLSEVNRQYISAICDILGIETECSWSMDYELPEGKTERLLELCRKLGAADYLSGPAAKTYIDANLFVEAGIKLRFMSYDGYPEYRQLFPPFQHAVSIIDLILNEGADARTYMLS
tara:strand:- start:1108 stop:1857 length:750 start_codon:yes stop_codon:yes gene_type:complete